MRRFIMFAAGCLAALTIGSAGAYFTAQAQVAENVVRAGSVAVSTEPTSAAIQIEALAPGATASDQLTVVNTGSLPESVVITAVKKAGITDFFEALTCRVTSDGLELYDGPLSALRTAPLTLDPAARTRIGFAIGLPATAGNDLAGDYAKLSLYVDAEQVH